jgi:hypothetical protein
MRMLLNYSIALLLGGCTTTVAADSVSAPTVAAPTTSTVVTTTTLPPETTTTTTVPPTTTTLPPQAPAGSRCPQHYGAALAAGWTPNEWATLDRIMWRESRCTPTAYNGNRRTRDDSYGLIQINMRAHKSWVGPLVEWDFNRLFDPQSNLFVARVLYERCGFGPWIKPYSCRRP